ncbi:HTH_Tnp_Tc3_2 domain-containing protein [Trichonephila clavipes]|uniref:HTH_Tnp_Tc3_2 domain-containing protein n=1 Tax=Trichonephila clavipes TaxID=2585209 RepID=A0A8X6RCQ1_TRICX|nr:HTH_Tnp_Tc3_2 domain-containing protein [Trichonephila clavipes]
MPLRRNRRQYEQLTDFDRGRIISLREAGWSNRRIGRHLGRSDMVVAQCWQQWITEGRVYRRGGHPVPSRETIRRRLTEVGLRSRRPLRRLPLTPHHRQCRLDFCRPRATWSVTDWRRVVFSDESRFSLSADDHRTCLEAQRPAVRSGIYCRAAYSNFTRCDSVGSNFLGHTIIFSGPSRHFDSSQIRGRYFNADCATHAIKSPRCHLSTR